MQPNKSLDASGFSGLVIDNLSLTWLSHAASTQPFAAYSRFQSMHPKHEQYPDQQSQPWTYRFEMVKTAVDVLASFSSELRQCTPPEVPEHLPSVRGWTIRFDGLGEYARQVPSAH